MVLLPLMLIWLRDPMYFNASTRWAMVALAATVGMLAPELGLSGHSGRAKAVDSDRSPSPIDAPRSGAGYGLPAVMREGTELKNRVGQFSRSDGGWFFTPVQVDAETNAIVGDGMQNTASTGRSATGVQLKKVRVLENLALQRVAQMIQQDPSDNRWMISGTITEFFGENRLIVVFAVRAPIEDAAR